MMRFPVYWHPDVEISVLGKFESEQRETRRVVLGTHTGTHCDAPRHFIPGGATIDQVPLDTLIGEASLIDFSDLPPRTEITVEKLEGRSQAIQERVILRFNWSKHWETPLYYSDHPFLSPAAAEWLVKKGVILVAMDTPMGDNPLHGKGSTPDSPIHKIFLGNNVVLVEYLANLDQIHSREVELIVMPLKIVSGDGSPARCAAVERY